MNRILKPKSFSDLDGNQWEEIEVESDEDQWDDDGGPIWPVYEEAKGG
jgi:hypothetical protein